MNIKKFALPGVLLIFCLGAFIYTNITYLYMPYQYKKSEIVPLDWTEFKGPLILEICHHDFEGECVYSTNEADIKFIIDSLQDLEYITESRDEFEALEYSAVDLSEAGLRYYFDNQYNVIIRQLETTKDGYDLGYWVYAFDLFTFSNYVNGPGGNYNYYELPDEVREFVYNAENDFISHEEMFGT